MESIFATRTYQRAARWTKAVIAVVALPALGAAGVYTRAAYAWLESRVSRTTVGEMIAQYSTANHSVAEQAFHGSSLADAHAQQLRALWEHQIAVDAELMVYRQFSHAPDRAKLIDEAQRFYLREWHTQLERHADNMAECAQQTMRAPWYPGAK